jgi:hypothetical protein
MRYQTEIVVAVVLSKNVERIEFNKNILVMLDCFECNCSGRSVLLSSNQNDSYCTPTKHKFNGSVTKFKVGDRKKIQLLSSKSIVHASYVIEYEFNEFIDAKYQNREVSPEPRWGRCSFTISCKCGVRSEHSIQNNIVRPWNEICICGRVLYYEREEAPTFKKTISI